MRRSRGDRPTGAGAHQGDMQCFPGNTAEALLSAVKKGAAMLEFDVQRCKTGDIVRKLKERGRLHQSMVCSGLRDIAEARKVIPEVTANNIERPGPRNRDWTDAECMKFVTDSEKHKCQYLQLSRPWAKKYSAAAHEAGVKVIHFHSDKPETVEDFLLDVTSISS